MLVFLKIVFTFFCFIGFCSFFVILHDFIIRHIYRCKNFNICPFNDNEEVKK